jgi:hypothetical protein
MRLHHLPYDLINEARHLCGPRRVHPHPNSKYCAEWHSSGTFSWTIIFRDFEPKKEIPFDC